MKKTMPVFPSFSRPSSDFPAVRTEMRAPPMYREIDLSTARSLAAGTAETLPIAGNMIYIDQKANSGYAVLHVQDDSYVGNTPITAFPGFLVRVPFTQIIFENGSQPGQVMRLIYGTDLDFVPTVGAGVSVLNAVNINDVVSPGCQYLSPALPTALGASQVTVVLAPASNPRGVVVRQLAATAQAGSGGFVATLAIASLNPPVGFGSLLNAVVLSSLSTSNSASSDRLFFPSMNRVIPAGWGIYNVTTVLTASAQGNAFDSSVEVL